MMRIAMLALPVLALALAVPAMAVDVGDEHTFWGWDLNDMPPVDRQVEATCRGVGDHGAIWVEDSAWGDQMGQDDVDAILTAWEDTTPIDGSKGIYEVITGVFGDPPDVDGDAEIHLLYYDLGQYGTYQFNGFFRSQDQAPGTGSNEMEILHLNTHTQDPGSDYMIAVAGHEFTHMIIYNYDAAESSWVQESLCEAAMIVCGYDTDAYLIDYFAAEPGTSLIPPTVYDLDYGASLLFGTYLYEQFGADFLTALVAEPTSGVTGVEAVLDDFDGPSFPDLVGQWTAANFADLDDDVYGYDVFEMPEFDSEVLILEEDNAFQVPAWAAQYFRFAIDSGTDYRVTIDSDVAGDLRVFLMEADGDASHVVSVTEFEPDGSGQMVWDSDVDGVGIASIAYVADGADAEGMITVAALGPSEGDDDDDDNDDDAAGDDDDDSGGCG